MAYRKTRQNSVEFFDGSNKSIGGFARAESDPDQSTFGPIQSPDGTDWWIVVDDLGALSATTTKP